MNKRIEEMLANVKVNGNIQEIAERAGCAIDKLGYGEGNLEKFAELIVRECMAQCADNGSSDEWDKGVRWAAEQIKQHFGIENT